MIEYQGLKTKKALLSICIIGALNQQLAYAEETQEVNKRALEKITVTSQKRVQSLSEVPMSVSAMNADKIEQAGIERLEDLSTHIPNFKIAKDSIADRINIRGMQSGNLAGFEQSVGTFVNGIYRGRGAQSRFSFVDVERVEVMRGPQSILFGKNTVAGALNITTAKPDDTFNGKLSLAYTPTFDQTEVSGMVTGSLSDSLRARAFVLSREMEEGWVHNNYYDSDSPQSEEMMGRVTLEWDAADNTLVTLIYEASDYDFNSFPHAMKEPGPLKALGSFSSYTESFMGNSSPVMNFGSAQAMNGDSDEITLISETDFASGDFTITAGHSAYQFDRSLDADYSGLDGIRFSDSEDFSQDSVEVRFASNTGGDFEYMLGLYWQQQDLTLDGLSLFNIPVLQQVLMGGCMAGIGAYGGDFNSLYASGDVVTTAAGVIGLGGSAGLVNACGTAAAFDGIPTGVGRYALLEQDADTLGVFAQGTWNINDNFRATFGLRYTKEEKSASKTGYATDFIPDNRLESSNPLVIAVSQQVGEFETHHFNSSDPGMKRSENSPTWSLNLQYDIGDNTMSYATASTGFKSGGFNSFYMRSPDRNNVADSRDVAFDEENVLAFELGLKTELLDGQADLNIAAFHSTFDDMQVSVFSGNTTFEVKNAAKAISYGIEMDGRWRATDDLTITGAVGLLNFEYDKFVNQACTSDQFLAQREAIFNAADNLAAQIGTAMGYSNANCAAVGINDLSGRTASNAPKVSASLVASHMTEFGDFELNSSVDLNYHSSVYRVDDLDPIGKEPSQTFVNAHITLDNPDQGWSLTLTGKNLTDVKHFDYINDVPLFAGAHNFMPLAGRSFTLRFNYSFGE
ncbi:TonB-dependent receptor [Thalassotalea sp. G2M2-11]|uniref:TonB-dependent receptor n=1 Tax=Thalassotalea sp. G2M2-11 TaxID=2787627 RepID=UPI0019CF75FD|nr:TonB-dependent receptor [Thalassotalea sp. G2M2-11]